MRTVINIMFLLLLFAPAMSFAGKHESPPHQMIDHAFYKCEESKNLEGGNYGKGPFKSFGPEESKCSKDEWVKINKEEFKRLATLWYAYDWGNEVPFWK